jgi:uncharacterized small protein (DUF1192 family)
MGDDKLRITPEIETMAALGRRIVELKAEIERLYAEIERLKAKLASKT